MRIQFTASDVFRFRLTRAKFESLCAELFAQCLAPVEKVLRDAKLSKHDIDECVFVGGSTRIPRLKRMLRDLLEGKEPCCDVDPDEAVAFGAAVHAAILSRHDANRKRGKHDAHADIFLLDVTPLSLGVGTDNGKMTVLIPRNTRLPTQKTQMLGCHGGLDMNSFLVEHYCKDLRRYTTTRRLCWWRCSRANARAPWTTTCWAGFC